MEAEPSAQLPFEWKGQTLKKDLLLKLKVSTASGKANLPIVKHKGISLKLAALATRPRKTSDLHNVSLLPAKPANSGDDASPTIVSIIIFIGLQLLTRSHLSDRSMMVSSGFRT